MLANWKKPSEGPLSCIGSGAHGEQREAETATFSQPGEEKAKGHLMAIFNCLMWRVWREQDKTHPTSAQLQDEVPGFSKISSM